MRSLSFYRFISLSSLLHLHPWGCPGYFEGICRQMIMHTSLALEVLWLYSIAQRGRSHISPCRSYTPLNPAYTPQFPQSLVREASLNHIVLYETRPSLSVLLSLSLHIHNIKSRDTKREWYVFACSARIPEHDLEGVPGFHPGGPPRRPESRSLRPLGLFLKGRRLIPASVPEWFAAPEASSLGTP